MIRLNISPKQNAHNMMMAWKMYEYRSYAGSLFYILRLSSILSKNILIKIIASIPFTIAYVTYGITKHHRFHFRNFIVYMFNYSVYLLNGLNWNEAKYVGNEFYLWLYYDRVDRGHKSERRNLKLEEIMSYITNIEESKFEKFAKLFMDAAIVLDYEDDLKVSARSWSKVEVMLYDAFTELDKLKIVNKA